MPWAGDAVRNYARPRAAFRSYAKPVEALKKGEVLEIGPDGKSGVWRNIGGNPIFIVVAKGESVPEAVRRAQSGKAIQSSPGGAILEPDSKAASLAALTKQFGEYSRSRELEVRAEFAASWKDFSRAVGGEAWILPGTLAETDPQKLAKAWSVGTNSKMSSEDGAKFMAMARGQAARYIGMTQWALSEGGKKSSITLYRGMKKSALGNAPSRGKLISFWSDDPGVAYSYLAKSGGMLVQMEVPISHVIASHKTANGRLSADRGEYLVNHGLKLESRRIKLWHKSDMQKWVAGQGKDIPIAKQFQLESDPAKEPPGGELVELPISADKLPFRFGLLTGLMKAGMSVAEAGVLSVLLEPSMFTLKKNLTPSAGVSR